MSKRYRHGIKRAREVVVKALIALFLICSSAQALTWEELEPPAKLKLKTPITFENGVTIDPSEMSFSLEEKTGLSAPGVALMYYEVKGIACSDPARTAPPSVVEANSPMDHMVGVELFENCVLGIYVEIKDYYLESLF